MSEPVRPPEQVVLARDRLGVTAQEWALAPTLVAAFQRTAYQRYRSARARTHDHQTRSARVLSTACR
jgi:hypothetical protein